MTNLKADIETVIYIYKYISVELGFVTFIIFVEYLLAAMEHYKWRWATGNHDLEVVIHYEVPIGQAS